jgi:hypothetical protein
MKLPGKHFAGGGVATGRQVRADGRDFESQGRLGAGLRFGWIQSEMGQLITIGLREGHEAMTSGDTVAREHSSSLPRTKPQTP